MIGIDAPTIPAEVIEFKPRRNWTLEFLVSKTMRSIGSVIYPDLSVALPIDRSGPLNAFAMRNHQGPSFDMRAAVLQEIGWPPTVGEGTTAISTPRCVRSMTWR